MRESVTYQEILQEGRQEGVLKGRQEGVLKGRQEGRKQGLVAVVLRLLTRKFGNLLPKIHTKVARLKIDRLENLAEAILDFETIADLELWFSKNSLFKTASLI